MQEAFCKRLALFQETPGVVNWHEHVWFDESGKLDEARLDQMMEHSAMLGVDSLVISLPVIWGEAVPALVTKCNDAVSQAVKKYPGRLYGMCFVNPGYAAFSMREIERCIEELGFVGIKLYNQYFISDPVLRGVLEKSIAYDIPVLEHACKLNMFADSQPFASNGVHFAKAAEEYPEARMILAHIGGGGDWNWQVKAIEPYPNVAVDMSGSIHDKGMIEYAAAHLGSERILFGSDGSLGSSVGKITDADLSLEDKRTILTSRAFARYLSKRRGA